MKTLFIQPGLLSVLSTLPDQAITVGRLTKLYLDAPDSAHTSVKSARQYVYRNMLRLIDHGYMSRMNNDGEHPKYSLTHKFREFLGEKMIDSHTCTESLNDRSTPLLGRLNQYKSELLAAMGEAEEFELIGKDLPDMLKTVQPLYVDARERSVKILGRIKAVESLISLSVDQK